MSRENSITTVLEINLWNSVGCWNNLPKQGYRDNHKPWLFHATLSATTPKRNIYRPNSNRLSCDYRTEHLNSEDTLQKVCRIPGVSSLSRDSINRQDILDKNGDDDDVYDKAAVLLWTEMTPLRISKKKTSQSATVGYALLAVNASEVVVSVIWKQVAPYLPYLGIRSNSMFSSRKTLSGYEGTTDKGAMQPQSTELTQWNLIPLTSHNYVFSSRSSSCTRKALFLFVMFFFAPQKVGVLQPLWGFMSFLCGVGPRRAIWKSQQQNDWWIAKLWTKTIF